jgi:hypothetical protein
VEHFEYFHPEAAGGIFKLPDILIAQHLPQTSFHFRFRVPAHPGIGPGKAVALVRSMMASQKLTNCCVAAIALVTAAYLSTPHSSTLRALHLALFA